MKGENFPAKYSLLLNSSYQFCLTKASKEPSSITRYLGSYRKVRTVVSRDDKYLFPHKIIAVVITQNIWKREGKEQRKNI